jgi:GTP-binding protein
LTHWNSETICTAWKGSELPKPVFPEIVFVGRSNVGKSTLINKLLGRSSKKVAYVSSKPGKTRSVNFYKINAPGEPEENIFCLVDMPGYGYASRGKDERENWWRLVNDYFRGSRDTVFVIHLVDFRHGFLKGDDELTTWLDGLDMPRLVVFTKGDKAPKGRSKVMYRQYVGNGIVSILPPVVTYGKNDESIEYLRTHIPLIINELHNFSSLYRRARFDENDSHVC